jgi:hypothetical protein
MPSDSGLTIATLLGASALLGIGMLLVFRYTSNQRSIRKAKAQLMASLYEMLLYGDEPWLVLRAQMRLFAANLRYIGLMLVPAAVMVVPVLLLCSALDAIYGQAPLHPGEAALVILQMRDPLDIRGQAPALEAPPGIVVETPAVRVPSQRQIGWRIRAQEPVSGPLTIALAGGAVQKSVEAGGGLRYVSERRVSSLWDLLWHPGESLIRNRAVEWVEVQYPRRDVAWLGLEMHWVIWALVFSMLTALLLKRRFKVVF